MKKMIILGLVALCFSVAGCYSDKGNYTYTEVNEVTISGLPEEMQYRYSGLDSIKITPQITGTLSSDPDDYTYVWQAVVNSGSADGKTIFPIGEELNLKYLNMLPNTVYNVFLLVTDKASGVTWRASFPLTSISSPLNEGWLILSDDDGYCRLDVVSTVEGKEVLVRDVWNGTPFAEMKEPRRLVFEANLYGNHAMYMLSGDGTFRLLDDGSFGYDAANDISYELGKYADGFAPADLAVNYIEAKYAIVTDDGDVYAKMSMIPGAFYGLPLNKIAGETETFRAAPAVGMSKYPYAYDAPIVLYDETNRRFVRLASNVRSVIALPESESQPYSFVTGKKFVWMGGGLQPSNTSGTLFAILEDDSGEYWLYGMTLPGYSNPQQLGQYYYRIDAPEIRQATAFAVHPLLYVLYYAVGGKIYEFDMVSKAKRELPLQMSEGADPVNALADEQITMLKFNIFGLGAYSKPGQLAAMEKYLIVGSSSTTETELPGNVRIFEVSEFRDRPATLYQKFSGFGDVVDMTYRERN